MGIQKKQYTRGIILRADDVGVDNIEGEIKVSLTSKKLQVYLDGALRNMVSENQIQTLTNKIIDADLNTITNIEVADLKAGTLNVSATLALATNVQIPSALAVKTYIDNKDAAQNEASEITVVPVGALAATNVQAGLVELQGDIDTINGSLAAHTASTTAHGATGAVVGTTNVQTLLSKSLVDTSTAIIDSVDATKKIAFDAAGTTATTTTIASSQTLNRTVTLPDATDTLVGKATTDVLTNKTIAAASNVITTAASGNLLATELNAALAELQTDVDTRATSAALSTHTGATSGAHAATAISTTAIVGVAGGLASTVQAVAADLKTQIDTSGTNLTTHINNTTGAHAASAISNAPVGNLAATNAQAALNELQSDIDTRATAASVTALSTTVDGKVAGPVSSVNNTVPRYDSSTGKIVKTSSVVIDDTNNVTVPGNVTLTGGSATLTSPLVSAGSVGASGTFFEGVGVDSTTSGASALISPSTPIIRVTNVGLTSIRGISTIGTISGRSTTLINQTGNTISILNNVAGGGTKILTGTKANITLADEASILLKYDSAKDAFMIVGGSAAAAAAASTSGAPAPDTMFSQPFGTAVLSDFTQTGLVLDTVAPLNGLVSAKLTHQAATSQSFKQTVAVPEKFRGQAMTMALVAKSNAALGNVTILFRDETAGVALQASQQISATNTAQTFQFGVTIPSTCLSFSYTITALQEAAAPVTFIDDIAFNSYFMGTAIEGQTAYSFTTPTVTAWADYVPTWSKNAGTVPALGNGTLTAKYRQVGQNIEGEVSLTFGSTTTFGDTAGTYTFTLPAGFLGDSTVINLAESQVGTWAALDSGLNRYDGILRMEGNTDKFVLTCRISAAAAGFDSTNGAVRNGSPFTFSTADVLTVRYTIPCVGLSATQTKTVTSTDIVPAKAMMGNASFSVPKITSQSSYITQTASFGAATITGAFTSTTGSGAYSYNSATGLYTALKSSRFYVAVSMTAAGAASVEATIVAAGSTLGIDTSPAVTGSRASASASFDLIAGQTFSVQNNIAGTTSAQFISVTAEAFETETKTFAVAQNGLVQDADLVTYAAGNAGQAITVDATNIPFTLVNDNSGAWNGSQYTVPRDGVYNGDVKAFFTAAGARSIDLYVNGVIRKRIGANTSDQVHIGSFTERFTQGQIISFRVSGVGGTLATTFNGYHNLSITQQGALKQVNVNTNQKARIATSELRFEGASTRGSTATAIVKFDTQARIRGDAFTVASTVADGTAITMTKAGKLDVSASLFLTSATSILQISKNQGALTTSASGATAVATVQNNIATSGASISASIQVVVGDIIRITTSSSPTASTENNLNLFFQEQEVQVSVSNTLPQFSESDSSVRVDGANGFGSTATRVRRFSNTRDSIGTAIRYTDDASLGGSFTALESGIYDVSYSDGFTTACYFGISKNASSLSSGISSLAATEVLRGSTGAANAMETVAWQGYLNAGDIVRPHTDVATPITTSLGGFTVSKVGKPNVTGVNVNAFINIPQPLSQSSHLEQGATYNNTVIKGALTVQSGSGIYSYNSTTGTYTVLKTGNFNISASLRTATATALTVVIAVRGVGYVATTPAVATTWATASYTGILNAGEVFTIENQTAANSDFQRVAVSATALADQILTAPETFSTDTAALTYYGSSTFTEATLSSAPVGSFVTSTYAINSNTFTQTNAAPPSQSVSSMNTNGVQVFTRPFNTASTSGNPARVAIQIGKGLKGTSLTLYKGTGKTTTGALDQYILDTGTERGVAFKEYNEVTGVLVIDAGIVGLATNTARQLVFNDGTVAASGFLVLNASKNPALTGLNIGTVASARIVSNAGTAHTIDTNIPFSTVINDTRGGWRGTFYEVQESGTYNVNAIIRIVTSTQAQVKILVNGSPVASAIVSASYIVHPISAMGLQLNRLDTVSIAIASAVTLTPDAGLHRFEIIKSSF